MHLRITLNIPNCEKDIDELHNIFKIIFYLLDRLANLKMTSKVIIINQIIFIQLI